MVLRPAQVLFGRLHEAFYKAGLHDTQAIPRFVVAPSLACYILFLAQIYNGKVNLQTPDTGAQVYIYRFITTIE
jgi:hypothetical protein